MFLHFVACWQSSALLPLLTMAQGKLSIDKVYSAKLRNSGPIISNNEVKGYFLFYQSDKIDKNTNEYTLQILDENVNRVKDIKFTDGKSVVAAGSMPTMARISCSNFSTAKTTCSITVYMDLDGKQKYNYTQELSKRTITYMNQKMVYGDGDDAQNTTLFGAEDKGFISVLPIRDGRQYSYQVSGYKTDKKGQWTYDPEEDDKFSTPAVFRLYR